MAPDSLGRPLITVMRQLFYNSGRVTTYVFLGGIASAVGIHWVNDLTLASILQSAMAVLAGLILMAIGLRFLGWLKPIASGAGTFSWLVPNLSALFNKQGQGAPLALGVMNGFLPCPLVYAFLAQAAVSQNLIEGMGIMAALGLGTFPAMLFMGLLGSRFRPSWRRRGVHLAGYLIILVGLITLARGLFPWVHEMRVHEM